MRNKSLQVQLLPCLKNSAIRSWTEGKRSRNGKKTGASLDQVWIWPTKKDQRSKTSIRVQKEQMLGENGEESFEEEEDEQEEEQVKEVVVEEEDEEEEKNKKEEEEKKKGKGTRGKTCM